MTEKTKISKKRQSKKPTTTKLGKAELTDQELDQASGGVTMRKSGGDPTTVGKDF